MNDLEKPKQIEIPVALKLIFSLFMAKSFFQLTNAPSNSVVIFGIAGLLFLGMSMAVSLWMRLQTIQRAALLIFALILTGATFLGNQAKVTNYNFYSGGFQDNYFAPISKTRFLWAIGFFLLSLVITLLLISGYDYLMKTKRFLSASFIKNEKKLFWGMWIVIFVCWSPYLICYYPGTIYYDSLCSVYQALGIEALSNHFPVLYTLLIRGFLNIGSWFGGNEVGCFLYTLFQMLLISGIFAYFLVWLNRKKCPKQLVIFIGAFYALTPIFPLHAISMWKDPIFAGFLLLLAMMAFDIEASNGEILKQPKVVVQLIIDSLVISFVRNNGIYIMLIFWIVLIFRYKVLKKNRIRKNAWVAATLGCCACYLIVTGPVYSALNIKTEFVESISIPLQQMSSVVVYGGKMTEEQQNFMFHLLPEEEYQKAYTPCCIDNIKWNNSFNEDYLEAHKGEFFKVWLEMLGPNFKQYVKAYVMETFEYWSFSDIGRNSFVDHVNTVVSDPSNNIVSKDYSEILFGKSLRNDFPFSYIFLSEGISAWIMLFVCLQICLHHRKRYFLALIPAFMVWITLLISAPLAAWQRYMLPVIFMLPLMLLLQMLIEKQEKQE